MLGLPSFLPSLFWPDRLLLWSGFGLSIALDEVNRYFASNNLRYEMQGFNSFLAGLKQMPATPYHHGSLHGHAEAALTRRQVLSGPLQRPGSASSAIMPTNTPVML
ncbi:hypothetical protein V8C40DRAFT_132356 [Trichoderma camerunense]